MIKDYKLCVKKKFELLLKFSSSYYPLNNFKTIEYTYTITLDIT